MQGGGIEMTDEQIDIFTNSFFSKISEFLKGKIKKISLDEKYKNEADILAENKYNNKNWINLF